MNRTQVLEQRLLQLQLTALKPRVLIDLDAIREVLNDGKSQLGHGPALFDLTGCAMAYAGDLILIHAMTNSTFRFADAQQEHLRLLDLLVQYTTTRGQRRLMRRIINQKILLIAMDTGNTTDIQSALATCEHEGWSRWRYRDIYLLILHRNPRSPQ